MAVPYAFFFIRTLIKKNTREAIIRVKRTIDWASHTSARKQSLL